ncbi:F-box/FBD/LRR-repeat protein At1g13570 [Linum perenne]
MEPPLRKSTGHGSRISELPDDVLHRILTFLPIKEAARTSVLSTKWRYKWRSIPHLVFDADFATSADVKNKVMLQIFQALLIHQGPIHRFELAIPGMYSYPLIDKLIPYLSTKSVKELTIISARGHFDKVLPSSVFSILNLNSLKLQRYMFEVPPQSTVGFSKLTLLELKEVDIPDDYDFFGSLLPRCPLLEELRVLDCIAVIDPLFESASLKALFFHSPFTTICFKDCPRLSVLSVVDVGEDYYPGIYDPDMVALFAALPALQQLKLGYLLLLFLSDGHVPHKLPAESLTNLEVLEIPCVLLGRLPEAQVLVCLIMSSPNLRRLTIVHDEHDVDDEEATDSLQVLLEPKDDHHCGGVCCLQRLEEFSIHDIRGNQVELDLVRAHPNVLPIKEAARTSVLSTKWRYQWRSIPHLVFDADFATFPEDYICNPDERNKVMLQIYQALLVHRGPINRFELAIPGMDRYPQIDQLIPYLSTKSVKELTIYSPEGHFSKALPSSIFSILNLNSLKLQRYMFEVPPQSTVGFSKLTLLELKEVDIPDNYDFFGTLLPRCPLLEELRVLDCNIFIEPLFESASLKALFFHSSFATICFKNTPRLSVLSVVDDYNAAEYGLDMVAIFAALPALKQLKLDLYNFLHIFSDGHVPYKLPSLTNLEVLEMPRLLLGRLSEARVLVCLIMSSPNLRRLTIVHDVNDVHDEDHSEAIDSLQMLLEPKDDHHYRGVCCLQRLEEFSIHNSRGNQVELHLVRFVLATAPLLKRVFIKPKKCLSSRNAKKFLVKVTQYKRISKEAEVARLAQDNIA